MDIIDRYAHEVGQYLPHRLRGDVQAELTSLLTDSVEEKALAGGVTPNEELAAAVLREFGTPKDVAARYAPEPQYLIGPRLYPTYVVAVKVMLPVLAALVVALVMLGRFKEPGEPASVAVFVRATGRFLWSALENLGIMTLVFALVERAIRQHESAGVPFDPASLPRADDPDKISYFGRIFALYVIAMLVVAFNFFPGSVAVFVFHGHDGTLYPLLTPDFSRYLPLLNVWWLAAFVLGLAVLRDGRWSRHTRWADFGLELTSTLILLLIVTGPPVFRYDRPITFVLTWFLVFSAIKACVMLYRLLRKRPVEPWAKT
ncbi:MAG: hypothetical protein Q7V01_10465 [Vicinamibacterales bacterium]|nr:hypothetical protein [Vicinamibacterales bacterium]